MLGQGTARMMCERLRKSGHCQQLLEQLSSGSRGPFFSGSAVNCGLRAGCFFRLY